MNAKKSPVIAFMHGALTLLTENWGLKLLALFIAIILYHSLKTGDYYNTNNDRQLFQYR